MTWCSKIYGMFNGWNAQQNDSSPIESSRNLRHTSSYYRHEIVDEPNDITIIQHDSPFLEKSDTVTNSYFPNESSDDFEHRDYRGEHFCADTLFSCHQRDEQFNGHINPNSYGIAIISNTALALPKDIKNGENYLQRRLSRSNSFESPMELRRQYYDLRSLTKVTPQMRNSLNQQNNRQRLNNVRSHRLSLNHASLINSEIPLENRQESFGCRISTRSTRSIPDYESNESQYRNNEQLEQEIQCRIKQMFKSSPNSVFPMIYRLPIGEIPQFDEDGYRIEGGYIEPSTWQIKTKIDHHDCIIESDNIANIYTSYFNIKSDSHYYAIDDQFNPIVISITRENHPLRLIIRTKNNSKFKEIQDHRISNMDHTSLIKQFYPDLHIDRIEICTNINSKDFIKEYDEKLETKKFKFGIIYQRKGQTTEEEFFNNDKHNQSFDDFLNILATRVSLKNFKGYRGGLDISEQTDSPISYYECYDNKEIMFHVSTLLPFTPNDPSQIQRKRHIGNDIVTIIFQEENTPFHPSMIKSSFLHVFLVIQPVQFLSRSCYKIMLAARDDVEDFGPYLQPNLIYVRTAENLKSFLLTKLINAEYAAYRCETFSLLQERTRCSLLKNLCEDLSGKVYEQLCDEQKRLGQRRSSLLSNSARKRYISSMKKMFSRSSTISDETTNRDSIKSEHEKIKTSKKLFKLGKSMDSIDDHNRTLAEHSNGRSDESFDSSVEINSTTIPTNQIYHGDESDEGLDSMSSAETARAHYDSDDAEGYRQQLRDKSQPIHLWYRSSSTHRGFPMPQTAGIHLSEEATV